jgi:TetR/AcrR family transcriptional repressor of nem operon
MMSEQFHGGPSKSARRQAMAALATMMGTIVLARAAGNGELSEELLSAGREAVLGRAAAPKPTASKAEAPKSGARKPTAKKAATKAVSAAKN